MNADYIGQLGGGGDKFRAARLLDPSLFSGADREAVKKSTSSKEVFLPREDNRKRPRDYDNGPRRDRQPPKQHLRSKYNSYCCC